MYVLVISRKHFLYLKVRYIVYNYTSNYFVLFMKYVLKITFFIFIQKLEYFNCMLNVFIIMIMWGSSGVMVDAMAIISEGSRFDPQREQWSFLANVKTVPVTGHV